MFRTENKKYGVSLLLVLLMIMFALTGCGSGSGEALDISKVTYVKSPGNQQNIEMYVISSDCTVKHYDIKQTSDKKIVIKDLFEGKLPSAEEYTVDSSKVSPEGWQQLENKLNETEFIYLSGDVSYTDQLMDEGSFFVEIQTGMIKHLAGGYNAGRGKDKDNKKFRSVTDILDNILADAG